MICFTILNFLILKFYHTTTLLLSPPHFIILHIGFVTTWICHCLFILLDSLSLTVLFGMRFAFSFGFILHFMGYFSCGSKLGFVLSFIYEEVDRT